MNAAVSTPLVRRIGQIHVNAHDLDRAVAFYRDGLGLPFLFQVPGMAFFRCGELTLMLGLPVEPEFDHLSSILYFDVADIEEAMRDARAAGLHVIDDTPRPGARGSKIAFLHPKSTGGILIHFVERPDHG